ncbi:MAG: GNAT family N-acetyltransferase, partial [Chloroflexi bacterium]|nr:GNAT family N-acetyltransferase [Chloroflexota bacterium]
MKDDIKIRPVASLAEMEEVENLEREIWNIPDIEIMPVHTMHAIQHNGGALLGAFDGDKMVGFVMGMLAVEPDVPGPAAARLKMYSNVAGTLPEYQGRGVGHRLKLAQRKHALKLGLDLITWTFDPLESLNGRFNFGKLGVVCNQYHRNFHGEMAGINAGLLTDRFEVVWHLNSEGVMARMEGRQRPSTLPNLLEQDIVILNETRFDADNLPVPPTQPRAASGNTLLMEIPANFQTVKQKSFDLA